MSTITPQANFSNHTTYSIPSTSISSTSTYQPQIPPNFAYRQQQYLQSTTPMTSISSAAATSLSSLLISANKSNFGNQVPSATPMSIPVDFTVNFSPQQKELLLSVLDQIQPSEPPNKKSRKDHMSSGSASTTLTIQADQLSLLRDSIETLLSSVPKSMFSYSDAFKKWSQSHNAASTLNYPFFLFINTAFQDTEHTSIKFFPKRAYFRTCLF